MDQAEISRSQSASVGSGEDPSRRVSILEPTVNDIYNYQPSYMEGRNSAEDQYGLSLDEQDWIRIRDGSFRYRLFRVLEGGYHPWDTVVEIIILTLILLNVVCFVLATVESFKAAFYPMVYFGLACEVIFTIELFARFYVNIEQVRIHKYGPILGRVRYFISFSGLIDSIAVVPYWVSFISTLVNTGSPWEQSLAFIAAIRIFRVFHLFRAKSYVRAVNVFKAVVKNNKELILTCVMYEVTIFLVCSTALYYAELRSQPGGRNTFNSIPEAMFDSILLLTGHATDLSFRNLTIAGQFVVGLACVVSLAMIAIPVGVISWGWEPVSRKYERYRAREKRLLKQRAHQLLEAALAEGLDVEEDDDDDERAASNRRKRISRLISDSESDREFSIDSPDLRNRRLRSPTFPFVSTDSLDDLSAASSPAPHRDHTCPTCHRPL